MNKKARVINKNSGTDRGSINNEDSSIINKEITKTTPVRFSRDGITAFQRNTKPTGEGLEIEQIKPSLFDERGRHINSESELRGECHICHKIVSLIFHCYKDGCKKLLCEEHVYVFKDGEMEIYCCREHFEELVLNQNTWEKLKKRKLHE